MCLKVNVNQPPKIPKSKTDPTGVAPIRNRALKDMRRRLKEAEKEVLRLFSAVPYTTRQVKDIKNTLELNSVYAQVPLLLNDESEIESECVKELTVNEKYYVYEMDATQLENFDQEIRDIINRWLETTPDNKPPRWFFDTYLNQSYGRGTAESFTNIQRIAPDGIEILGQPLEAIEVEQVLLSAPYRDRIERVRARSFNNMKGFSESAAKDLSIVFQNAMAAGDGVNDIKRQITSKFDQIEGYRAERIARTEINKAYTDSRMDMNKQARDELGINTALMHVSALAPTSRRDHVARSGNIYTVEQQEKWWNTGANRINCLCTVVEVLIDSKGNPINDKPQEIIKEDKADWLASN